MIFPKVNSMFFLYSIRYEIYLLQKRKKYTDVIFFLTFFTSVLYNFISNNLFEDIKTVLRILDGTVVNKTE